MLNNISFSFSLSVKATTVLFLLFVFTKISAEEPLSVGFWNVENLFDLENHPNKNDDEFALGGRKNVTKEIYNKKIKHTAEVLEDLNVDVLGLCEVENKQVLIDLNNAYPKRNYKIVHYESPDERGIDNALLYDPNKFLLSSSRPIVNVLPSGDKTRDILHVEGIYAGNLLHVFVNHWPSNYGGKEKSIPKRASTAKVILREVSKIMESNSGSEILLVGDFNEDPNDPNIQKLLDAGLESLMLPMLDKPKTGTYVYRGKDYLYDQIIVNSGLRNKKGLSILNNSVSILDQPKYRQQEGRYAHYPFRFWAGNRLLGGYSDHLAVKVQIVKL